MPSSKPRLAIYFEDENFHHLQAVSERPGEDCSSIVNKALKAYFINEHEVQRDAALLRRLDRMTRQSSAMKREQIVFAEAFTLFVRYFLTVIPPVPEADKKSAQAQGAVRFEGYLNSLRTVLADGERILFTALDDITADESAYFSKEELMRLHEPAPEKDTVDA